MTITFLKEVFDFVDNGSHNRLPVCHELKEALKELCDEYLILSGLKFKKTPPRDFIQRINDPEKFDGLLWEMLLARKLKKDGLDFRVGGKGEPDFLLLEYDCWIEAVVPNAEGIPNEHLVLPPKREIHSYQIPCDHILLRWASAVSDKNKKLLGYKSKGIVTEKQGYIIAVNGSKLGLVPLLDGQSGLPYPVEIGFGVGPKAIEFNPQEEGFEEIFRFRKNIDKGKILNRESAEICTKIFWEEDYKYLSAILGGISSLNEMINDPQNKYALAHNPRAINRLSDGALKIKNEYVLRNINNTVQLLNYADLVT